MLTTTKVVIMLTDSNTSVSHENLNLQRSASKRSMNMTWNNLSDLKSSLKRNLPMHMKKLRNSDKLLRNGRERIKK